MKSLAASSSRRVAVGLLACALLAAPCRAAQRPRRGAKPPPATPSPTPTPETWQEEVYRLGREALARGSFETASHLFELLESDVRWAGDSRFAFNRAQAARYLNDAGEAAFWYGKYLALDPDAPDARAVHEQVARLVKAFPRSLRAAAQRRAVAEYEQLLENAELQRAIRESPQLRFEVRFVRREAQGSPAKSDELSATKFIFPGRAIYWKAPAQDTPDAGWTVWAVATAPVSAPEGVAAPPLLFLPPGRPFEIAMGSDLVSRPVSLRVEVPPFFPEDPDLTLYRVELTAQVERVGPPVLLVGARGGAVMVDVRSGPAEGPLALGKKRRELPLYPTPLSFGPRMSRPDSKVFPNVPLAVIDVSGREGTVERWGAPVGAFDVVNRFGKLVPGEPERLVVRPDGTGPALTALPRSAGGAAKPAK